MSGGVKVSGAWKNATTVSVKVGGVWKNASAAFIKVGGVWKQWLSSIISDAFNRTTSGSLGNTDTGQTWSALRGTWYANGSNARSDTSASSYALASVSLPSQDATVSADITDGGPGLAFWVTDANSWWASSVSYGNYSVAGSPSCSGGAVFVGSAGQYPACGGFQINWSNTTVTVPGVCPSGCFATYYAANGTVACAEYASYQDCGSYAATSSCTGPGGIGVANGCGSFNYYYWNSYVVPVYTYYTTNLNIYSSVSGTISSPSSLNIATSGSTYSKVNSMAVTTSGNTITVRGYSSAGLSSQLGSTLTYTPTSPTRGTGQGIIKTPGGDIQGSLVDNFSASI